MHLQRFLDRLITSASFAAYTRLLAVLGSSSSSSTTTTRASFSVSTPATPPPLLLVAGLVPLAIAGMVCTARLRGLQNVCAMIAGHGLTQLVPLPAEPNGYLVLPSAFVYLALIAATGAAVQRVLSRIPLTGLTDAMFALFQQYVDLFAITRAFLMFQTTGMDGVLAVVSLVYLALPPGVAPGNFLSALRLGVDAPLLWEWHMVNCIENLAARGAMLWCSKQLASWGTEAEALVLLHLFVVQATASRAAVHRGRQTKKSPDLDQVTYADKLAECHATLSLLTAQHALVLLSKYGVTSLGTSVALLGALVALIRLLMASGSRPWQDKDEDEHMFEDVCAFTVSLLLTQRLQQFLNGVCLLDACGAYLCVFVLLEYARSDAWSDVVFSATPAQGASGGLMLLDGGEELLLF